jgi:hypothetical protein
MRFLNARKYLLESMALGTVFDGRCIPYDWKGLALSSRKTTMTEIVEAHQHFWNYGYVSNFLDGKTALCR